ncbi:hypothetical protein D9758_003603 [Tetrapyrgos nigripes]|uniref:Myb-like domain-containing protein n=1 Tax=Tetrapyrgos nigripes TaxID=182062 RepID=A0A8H5GM88_9AGAR|nr:hypothetical protein D9758_003603 [Tetrapyrgos nigripes]
MPRTRRQTAQIPQEPESSESPEPESSPSSQAESSGDEGSGTEDEHTSADEADLDGDSQLEDIGTNSKAGNRQSSNWLPWQDRALIQQVNKVRPFEAKGKSGQKWEEVSHDLLQSQSEDGTKKTPIQRSGESCKRRFNRLIEAHQRGESESLQKTGTNEEVTGHVQLMAEIYSLFIENQSNVKSLSAKAQQKVQNEANAGLELREASMKGMVPREGLTDVAVGNATVRERQGQRRRRVESDSDSDSNNKENLEPKRKRVRTSVATSVKDAIQQHLDNNDSAVQEAQERELKRQEQTKALLTKVVESNDKVAESVSQLVNAVNTMVDTQQKENANGQSKLLDALLRKI